MGNNELLELLLTAEVLSLGKQIKAEKTADGTQTTRDCTSDAVREIKRKRAEIIGLLKNKKEPEHVSISEML